MRKDNIRQSEKIIYQTSDYSVFQKDPENRAVDLSKKKRLVASMKRWGFIPDFHCVCRWTPEGKLKIRDGQHRAAVAEMLGLPVFFSVCAVDFDIAEINCTAKVWAPRDYAQVHSSNGLDDYSDGLRFAETYRLPIGIAFAMLAGTTTFGNIKSQFESGTFRVTDRDWAMSVASLYTAICEIVPESRNIRGCLGACMSVCRVPSFSMTRLLQGVRRKGSLLSTRGTRDSFLAAFEDLYNFGRSDCVGLKAEAKTIMRQRNVIGKNKAA